MGWSSGGVVRQPACCVRSPQAFTYLCAVPTRQHSRMDNTRMSRINRLIQKEVSDLFRQQTQALPGTLVTVTSVTVSPDLSIARVRLSIFPTERGEELLETIRSNARAIRYDLGLRVGKQLRKLPELTFFIDDSLDYLERIDELLGR